MINTLIGIYGASGFGKEVYPLVREQYPEAEYCFIDDGVIDIELNGAPIFSYEIFVQQPHKDKKAVIAIADSKIRELLTDKLDRDGIKTPNLIASNSIIMDCNEIGKGAVLCPFTTITSNVIIGKGFHSNIYSYVAHDCCIGDFVTFAPGVKCNGNVKIENYAYIGTGAVIKQGTPKRPIIIGEGAVIGMGAIVTKSVKAGDVVFGNPAKSIKRGK